MGWKLCADDQLTGMSNLEILDLSKNQITSFPAEPGQLACLKVLSLNHNRLYTLPSYLATFDNLKVFKVASNPIEWPVSRALGVGKNLANSRGSLAKSWVVSPKAIQQSTRLLDDQEETRIFGLGSTT